MTDTLINHERICHLLGCKRPSDAAKLLEQQGIIPIRGRPGFWFVTLDQINAARGIVNGHSEPETTLF